MHDSGFGSRRCFTIFFHQKDSLYPPKNGGSVAYTEASKQNLALPIIQATSIAQVTFRRLQGTDIALCVSYKLTQYWHRAYSTFDISVVLLNQVVQILALSDGNHCLIRFVGVVYGRTAALTPLLSIVTTSGLP